MSEQYECFHVHLQLIFISHKMTQQFKILSWRFVNIRYITANRCKLHFCVQVAFSQQHQW